MILDQLRVLAVLISFPTLLTLASCDDPTGIRGSYNLRPVYAGELAYLKDFPAAGPIAGLNNTGQVVFTAAGQNYSRTAYLWERGNLTSLGSGMAFDLNDAGQIVGSVDGKAVLWGPDRVAQVVYSPPLEKSFAVSIDASGSIVAFSESTSGCTAGLHCDSRVVRIAGTSVTTIGYGRLVPSAANLAGTTVGLNWLTSLTHRAVILKGGSVYTQLWAEGNGIAFDINNSGVAVGSIASTSGTYPTYHAVRWGTAGMEELTRTEPTVHSEALGINDAGDIVGSVDGRAVLWKNGGETIILDQADDVVEWRLLAALDINDRGDILAWGTVQDGLGSLVLLVANS